MDLTRIPSDKSDFSKHDKSYYIRKYSEFIINNIPELEEFILYDIPEKFNFDEDDKLRFRNSEVNQGIKNFLLKGGFATHHARFYTLSFGAKCIINQNKNDTKPNPKKKMQIFTLNNITSLFTIAGVIIGFILIPEDTPYLGMKWWKHFLGL